MRDYLEVAVEAAKIGGDVLRQYYGKAKDIEYKAEIDLVTHVDKRSEQLIVEWLNSRFPHHSILAEEGTEMQRSEEFRWVVDPLDGTTNYAHDYPLFAVSVAMEQNSKLIVGGVYNPVSEELLVAEKKWSLLNGRKIQVSQVNKLRQALVSTGFHELFKI
jgi:myo-inositol-1(or 4)-monophosphatase